MKAVIQRVDTCSVEVEGECISSISKGLLILLGVSENDSGDDVTLLARKCSGLRIFSDDAGKMNHSVKDINGEILVVSQFTLFGDVKRGLRPYFGDAAKPEKATVFYERFIEILSNEGLTVKGGSFGAHMHVTLLNDGPVTIILDTEALK